jgi:hypothetical protein
LLCWLNRRLSFSCNAIMPGPIQVWIPWSMLHSLAGLSYHTLHVVWIWHLTTICLGQYRMEYMGNIFLTMTSSSQLWESGLHLLVQIFASAACRFLFIAGENA